MGCISSTGSHDNDSAEDLIHPLSNHERIESLCAGYMRRIEIKISRNASAPTDVTNLCALYIQDITIKSPTDIRLEMEELIRRRKQAIADTVSSFKENHHKITMLAAGYVGQSRVTLRFVVNEYKVEYDPTIEDFYTSNINVDNQVSKLDILDTATAEQFSALKHHWIREGEIFIITYAIHRNYSFRSAKKICEQINKLKLKDLYLEGAFDGDQYPAVVLCGNQMDRPDTERQVSTNEAKKFADEQGIGFIEVSAKTGQNVTELFEEAVRLGRKMRKHLKELYDIQNEGDS